MGNNLSVLLFSFLVGFGGAVIPVLGPASSLILHRALKGKHTEGISMSFGISIMESIYCGIGIAFVGLLIQTHEKFNFFIKGFSSLVFSIVGIYFLSIKSFSNEKTFVQETCENVKDSFLTGLMMIALNPSIMLTWSAVAALLISFNLIDLSSFFSIFIFSISAGFGIFIGSVSMIFIVKFNRHKITENVVKNIFVIVGACLIFVSLYGFYGLI